MLISGRERIVFNTSWKTVITRSIGLLLATECSSVCFE
jgi:hypothetical protein